MLISLLPTCLRQVFPLQAFMGKWQFSYCRASDFFQDWWAKMTHEAKNGGSFCEMMGPSRSNLPQFTFGLYTLPTH